MNRQRSGNHERTDFDYNHNCVYCREGVNHTNQAHWHVIKKNQKAQDQLQERRRTTRSIYTLEGR